MNKTESPSSFELMFGIASSTAAVRMQARCLPIVGVHARDSGALLIAAAQADLVGGGHGSLALDELVNAKKGSTRE